MASIDAFVRARDLLLERREDHAAASKEFAWPRLERFNWALDYFDAQARGNQRIALWVVNEDGTESKVTFAAMRERSDRVANFLRAKGVKRGDRVLVMLPNVVPLWEVTLAVMKLGAVISPATTLLAHADLQDRVTRGDMRHVIADAQSAEKFAGVQGSYSRIVAGAAMPGWTPYAEADGAPAAFTPDAATGANDPFLLYFTSGTTAKPKMVMHTHQSYPVGHLSTMYWIGLRPGDVHLNISSPGWAKHAWSCFFAPWNAGATIFLYNQARFDAKKTLDTLVRCKVTTLCAPPTVWRVLILEDLKSWPVSVRELISAGEPLNPEVIEQVRAAWGHTIRDGYGQTETTCMIGNSPGQPVKVGSMGKSMPGYRMALTDADGREVDEGEICVKLKPGATGLMAGYVDDPERTSALLAGDYFRTSDVARRDADGYYWYVGRDDDVFKSSDYRVSPFELESALIEHESVAEAAVIPSPDPRRMSVPKAIVMLKPGLAPTRDMALSILGFVRAKVAPYKRIRRIEFADLPKTISGKIRRVQLRGVENERRKTDGRGENEFWEEDFPELK
jgi:acetyl-CoA synthetase